MLYTHSDFEITWELEPNINIYLIIDPLKDNNFKKYAVLSRLKSSVSFHRPSGSGIKPFLIT